MEIKTAFLTDAIRLNKLGEKFTESRREFCVSLAKLIDGKLRPNGIDISTWCGYHLHKSDGTPWALSTIYNYASQGRDPDRLERAHVRNQRINFRGSKHAKTIAALLGNSRDRLGVESQISFMLELWEKLAIDAKVGFLEYVRDDLRRISGSQDSRGAPIKAMYKMAAQAAEFAGDIVHAEASGAAKLRYRAGRSSHLRHAPQ